MESSVHPQVIDLETVEGRAAFARRRLPELRTAYLSAFDSIATGKRRDTESIERRMHTYTGEAAFLVTWL